MAWTPLETHTLIDLYNRGDTYPVIAAAMGITKNRIIHRINRLRDEGVIVARRDIALLRMVAAANRSDQVAWTADDIDRAIAMREDGHTDAEIGAALGRSRKIIGTMIAREQRRRDYEDQGLSYTSGVPPHRLIDREMRNRASESQSLTQQFFGDPPPGFSALDRRAR